MGQSLWEFSRQNERATKWSVFSISCEAYSEVYEAEDEFRTSLRPILKELFASLDAELDKVSSQERKEVTSDFTVMFKTDSVTHF